MDRGHRVVSFVQMTDQPRQYELSKRRQHYDRNGHKIQKQHRSHANAMRSVTLGTGQESACNQSETHDQLYRYVQIGATKPAGVPKNPFTASSIT